MTTSKPPCRLAALAALLLAAATTAPSAAQDPSPLYVAFEFGDYPMAALFDAEDATEIAASLAAETGKPGRLPYWRFAAAEEGDYPRLNVRIEEQAETGDFELVTRLHLKQGDAGHGTWRGLFISRQELAEEDGFPARPRVPGRIRDAFVENVLTESRVSTDGGEMFERLTQLVPVVSEAHLTKDAEEGMLGLDRREHGALALSTFKLVCKRADGTVVALYSKGSGEQRDFPSPAFPAIVVVHDRWQEGTRVAKVSAAELATLDSLRPDRVFLEEFDPMGLALAAANGGSEGDDLQPSVVTGSEGGAP